MANERTARQIRSCSQQFTTREAADDLYIEGYFAVFNSEYPLWEGASEIVKPGAFDTSVSGDVRALINHDTTLVLGRTKSGTLTLRQDTRGLWGSVKINRQDGSAMDLYARVQRGDVDQCSFGFEIKRETFVDLGGGNACSRVFDLDNDVFILLRYVDGDGIFRFRMLQCVGQQIVHYLLHLLLVVPYFNIIRLLVELEIDLLAAGVFKE